MPQYILIAKETSPKKFADYRIIEDTPTIPDEFTKLHGPASLDDCVRELSEIGENSAKWMRLTFWQYGLIATVTLAFIVVIIWGAFKLNGIDNKIANNLITNPDDAARILITFLVAVATVAIAFLAILTAMIIREYKERFALAKEILTILVGILGTIIGFYFGTANNPASKPDANANTSTTPANTNTNTNTNVNTNTNAANPAAVIFRAPLEKGKYVATFYDRDKKRLFTGN